MQDKLQAYRQPMVTATGILLGFILGFAYEWSSKSFAIHTFRNAVAAIGLWVSVPMLLLVLYRILNMNYPKEQAEAYYQKTLRYFIIGTGAVFLAIFIVMLESQIKSLF